MKTKLIAVVLLLAMLVTAFAACKTDHGSNTGTSNTPTTEYKPPVVTPPAGTPFPEHVDPPAVPAGASKYSGTADTSWYDESKTEFILTTADQFVGFQELRSASRTFEGKTVKLACDVVFNEGTVDRFSAGGEGVHSWKQINSGWLFKGTFDGQGHIISGIYMQLGASAVRGMFGGVGGNAVIKNFTLINSYFGGPSANKNGLGSIIAKVGGADAEVTVSNVVSFATIQGGSATIDSVGGLIGTVVDKADVTVENCGFHGSIRVDGKYAGGILGYVDDKESNVTLKGCHNSADITATQYAGGLMGVCVVNCATVENSDNTGTVTSYASNRLCPIFSSYVDPNPGQRPTVAQGYTGFRVMSFNVQNDVDMTNGIPSTAGINRMNAVKAEIAFYDPDFLGLQEDGPHWHSYMDTTKYNHIMGSGVSGEACAIYYKKGITLLDSGCGWLTSDRKNGSVALTMADITTPSGKYYMTDKERADINITASSTDSIFRTKMYNYVDDKTGETLRHDSGYYLITSSRRFTYGVFDLNGQTVIYVNTHLTHRSPNEPYYSAAYAKFRSLERVKELEIMQKTIDEVKAKYPGSQVVITGDMNDEFGTQIYQEYYAQGYESAHANTVNKFGPAGSWNNAFKLDQQGNNYPNTAKEATSRDYLDYCFVTPGVNSLKFTSGDGKAVVGNNTYYTSDHLPIIADLSIKTDKTGPIVDPNYKDPGADVDDMSKPSVYNGVLDTSWYTKDKKEYVLNNASQLMGFFYLRSMDNSFEGVTIKLNRDVIINEGTAAEIKNLTDAHAAYQFNSAYLFKGVFDGQGHYIAGVYMQTITTCARGLFGSLGANSVIQNLTIKNSYYGGPSASDKSRFGVIAPLVNGTGVKLTNVHVEDVLMQTGSAPLSEVGGLVGRVSNNSSVTIDNCSVSGVIDFAGGTKIGGMIGSLQGSTSYAVIKNSSTNVTLTAAGHKDGFVGYQNTKGNATITDSTASGTVN